ncbi:MAG TPA: hypothetical protein VMR45_02755 [Patescibacteria group bacterium]|nr:hypothetical protein [Patescibacteria group bacterium]
MHIVVVPDGNATVLNEAAPLLVFALAFVIALGGIWALAIAVCGYGHVNMATVDFWKAQAKIQCR